jgi:hypothetical protein
VPVCTTTTCAAPAGAEAEAVVVELGGSEVDGVGDGLVAAAVGLGVELERVVVVDLLHAESRAIVAARATRPNRCMFTRSPHSPSSVRLGERSNKSQIPTPSSVVSAVGGRCQQKTPGCSPPESRAGARAGRN